MRRAPSTTGGYALSRARTPTALVAIVMIGGCLLLTISSTASVLRNLDLIQLARSLDFRMGAGLGIEAGHGAPNLTTGQGETDTRLQNDLRFGTAEWLLALQSGCAAVRLEEVTPANDSAGHFTARPVDLFHRGVCHALMGNVKEAAQDWSQVPEPGVAETVLRAAQYLAGGCCHAEAERLVAAADEFGYESSGAYFELGQYYRRLGQLEAASQAYIQSAQRAPDDARIIYRVGVYLYLARHLEESARWLEHAAKLAPEDDLVAIQLGYTYREWNKTEDAAKWFLRASNLAPKDPLPLFGLASLERKRNNWPEALRFARLAATLDPDYLDGQAELADYLVGAGMLDEAEAVCRQILARSPDNASAYYELGIVAEARGQWQIAYDFYKKAFTLNPSREAAQQGVTRMERKLESNNEP